jgi:bleomycin hydrolase
MVPEPVYAGLNYGFDYHQHNELERVMKGVLDNSLKSKRTFTGRSLDVISAILDIYLGVVPETFSYNKEEYTPESFAASMAINPDEYVELTSYSVYPFYEAVDLELPDNWSHDTYYNLPIDEFMEVMNYAFENGYSVNWDGDVSEQGFSHSKGVAVLPEDDPVNMDESERLKWEALPEDERDDLLYKFDAPRKEKQVTQEMRQLTFDTYKTTDDHLMHLVGTAVDQNGTLYFKTKNSWAADSNKKGGFLYMSEPYVRLKTVAIMVHKDAIPHAIKEKLGL